MASIDLLVSLVNAVNSNEPPFTSSQLTFKDPMSVVNANWNTIVSVSFPQESVYSDPINLTYTRLDLSVLGTNLTLTSDKEFNFKSILYLLNEKFGTEFDETDLEQINIPCMQFGQIRTVALKAKATSLGWVGSSAVTLLYGLPNNINALHTLMNVTLPNSYLTN